MKRPPGTEVFKPKPSSREAKGDATTVAARAILDREATVLATKTAQLRALRLAREAAEIPPSSEKPSRRRR